ncbi:hypothetical protein K523DRAFT_240085, partial [Schizophyllum commune Tattone D]
GHDESFKRCTGLVDKHDNSTCTLQREEIDTLLVFAGLFSAVLTAFIIDSYKWLMVQTDDIMADYLRQMVALMSHVDVSSVSTTNRSAGLPEHVMARINGFWFSSLALSPTSALVGIVSKQWLREYLRDTGHSYKTNLAVRQVKYEGLSYWNVNIIVSAIPLLLQTALFLFLLGILDLLWNVQTTVAKVVTGLCSSTMLFFLLTTVLPGVQFLCHHRRMRLHVIYQLPFKSPQAWLFLRVAVMVANFVAWAYAFVKSLISKKTDEHGHVTPYQTFESWTQYDLDWTSRRDLAATWHNKPSALSRCLGFMELTFEHASLRDWIWNCLRDLRDRAVDAKYVLQCFRRDTDEELDLSAIEDRIIHDVKHYLDPQGVSRPTSEAILLAILNTGQGAQRDEARLEHIIRILNSLILSGTIIPRKIYEAMQNALRDVAKKASSVEMRLQLFYVAQSLLRRINTTDDDLRLIFAIVVHLIRGEVQGQVVQDDHPVLIYDFANEVVEWLEGHPVPDCTKDWMNYKSRVLWAAQTAVVIARKTLQADPMDVPTQQLRLSSVRGLVDVVYAKALSIPDGTIPTWTPEGYSMDELHAVRASLDVPPQVQQRHRKQRSTRKGSTRTDSTGTLAQVSVILHLKSTTRSYPFTVV